MNSIKLPFDLHMYVEKGTGAPYTHTYIHTWCYPHNRMLLR